MKSGYSPSTPHIQQDKLLAPEYVDHWLLGQEGTSEVSLVSAFMLLMRKQKPWRGAATRPARSRAGMRSAQAGPGSGPLLSFPHPSSCINALALRSACGPSWGVCPLALPSGTDKARRRDYGTCVSSSNTVDGGVFVFSQHVAFCMLLCSVLHCSLISRTGPGTG